MDNPDWEVPEHSGMTLARSLALWLNASMQQQQPGGGADSSSNVHVDAEPWPHNQPCSHSGEAYITGY